MTFKYARMALLAAPVSCVAMFATSVIAAPNERTSGRDSTASQNFDRDGQGTQSRGSDRFDRADRGGRDDLSDRRDSGDRVNGEDGGDRVNRGDGGDRVNRGDRGQRFSRDRGDGYEGPRRRWSGGDGRRDRWRSGHRYNWGPGFAFYFYDGYYYGECSWLKRRVRVTGDPVWWYRYERCRDAV